MLTASGGLFLGGFPPALAPPFFKSPSENVQKRPESPSENVQKHPESPSENVIYVFIFY